MPITGRTRIATLLDADPVVQEVLEEYGLDVEELDRDRSLEQVCREAGVNYWEVKSELVAALPGDGESELDEAWEDVEEEDDGDALDDDDDWDDDEDDEDDEADEDDDWEEKDDGDWEDDEDWDDEDDGDEADDDAGDDAGDEDEDDDDDWDDDEWEDDGDAPVEPLHRRRGPKKEV